MVGGGAKGGPQKFALFIPSPATIFFLPSLSWGPFVEFWWCLKRRDPEMCTFGVLGLSCEAPAGVPPAPLPTLTLTLMLTLIPMLMWVLIPNATANEKVNANTDANANANSNNSDATGSNCPNAEKC